MSLEPGQLIVLVSDLSSHNEQMRVKTRLLCSISKPKPFTY